MHVKHIAMYKIYYFVHLKVKTNKHIFAEIIFNFQSNDIGQNTVGGSRVIECERPSCEGADARKITI